MAYTMANRQCSSNTKRYNRNRWGELLHTAENQKSIYPNIPDKPSVRRTGKTSLVEPSN